MKRRPPHWTCPKCREPQFGKEQDQCPACEMEAKGHWKDGVRHCWDTFGNILYDLESPR